MLSLSSSFPSLLHPLSSPPLSRPSLFSTHRTRTALRVTAAARPQCPPAGMLYEVLAVVETAGPAEIKAAYRRQARRWHPDACRSAGEKPFFAEQFMRARKAYDVLSDPILRHDYDLALRAVGGGAGVRARGRERFGDWEVQLEVLRRRKAWPGREATWGSMMRSSAAHRSTAV